MARVALIKLFSGLNIAPAQLSGELVRAGHDSRVIYFKEFHSRPMDEDWGDMVYGDTAAPVYTSGGVQMFWGLYKPFTEADYNKLITYLREFDPQAIGFFAHVGIVDETNLVAARLRKAFPDAIFAVGGAAPTLEPERFTDAFDILCSDEGEEVIVEIANAIDAQQPVTGIHGTWFCHRDGRIEKYPRRPKLDLDKIAMPDWDMSRYAFINERKVFPGRYPPNLIPFGKKEYPLMTQRGCPFSCSFCFESAYQDMHGKGVRRRHWQLILDELVWAKEHLQPDAILFMDDVFTLNVRWLKEFLPRYKEQIDLPFWAYTYPTTHNPEILALLKDSGCHSLTMGVQTGSERLLELYNRPTEIKRVIEAGKEVVEAGIEGLFDLITVGPHDTEEDLRLTFEFLMEFPQAFRSLGFGHMALLPKYKLTDIVATDSKPSKGFLCRAPLPEKLYDYYHKLYRLTRTEIPRDVVRAISEDPQFREHPERMDEMLSQHSWNASYWFRSLTA
jgi:radical SAM superfamily enzyme YgiQ (UPF0313 family)